ncbi:MAG: two-component regulator propeller domain-containing protein [Bacteroidales bacterium]
MVQDNKILSVRQLFVFVRISQILMFFNFYSGYSQDHSYYFNLYTIENGLSQSSITTIAQDNKGFIWLGTQSGLNRFDGYKFKNWFHEPGDSNSLTSGFINHIATDKQNNIWIGTTIGLNCFDSKVNQFYSFGNLIKNKNLSNELINYIFVDNENYLWVGTKNGLNRSVSALDKLKPGFEDLRFTGFFKSKSPESISNNEITCIYADKKTNIWVGTKYGLNKYSKKTGKFEQYYFGQFQQGQNGANEINDIEQINDSVFWVATEAGLFELNINSKSYSNFETKPFFRKNVISGSIRAILTDKKGNIWLGTFGNGLLLFTANNKEFYQLKRSEISKNTVSDNFISCLFEDKSGTLFVGNFTNGLNTTKINQNHFQLFRHDDNDERSLSENITRHICCQDENTVWMGTLSKGLEKFNPKTGKFEHIPFNNLKKNNTPAALQYVLPVNRNELWIGTNRAGLLLYNCITNTYKQYTHSVTENSISGNDIYWLYADKDSVLWIGTYGTGLDKLDLKTGKFKNYRLIEFDSTLNNSGIITYIIPDKNKDLWIGSWGGGLMKFNPKTEEVIHYKNSITDKNSISSDFVLAIHIDKNGILWIGTASGLNKYNPATGKFEHYGKKNGFRDEFINSIEEDKKDNLWISTNKGIVKFNKQSSEVTCFNITDGLQDNEFSSGINTSLPDGRMIFGGIRGFNIFHPDSIVPGNFSPNIVITAFQLFYKNVEAGRKSGNEFKMTRSISYLDTIILNYKDNVIGFEFTALDFKNPENIRYAFRLKGFEENWNNTSSEDRFARYTNLGYGNYVLQIKSTNSDGFWNNNLKELHIIIKAPIWLTNEFWGILLSAVVILSVGIYRIRINVLKNQKIKLEEIIKERTTEIQNKNLELKERYEEIVTQEEEIREQAEELYSLSEKLKESNQDLSEKVRERTLELEEALYKSEDAQKLISSFLSNLSHEIRTPLNAVLGFTQILAIDDPTEEKRNHYTRIIEENVESLLTQIGNIMDIAKLHTNQYHFENREFLLGDLFQQIYNQFNIRKHLTKEIEFVLNIPAQPVYFTSDYSAIRNIIFNLVENALKYTEKGKVEFGFKTENAELNASNQFSINAESDKKLNMFVIDTGIGISENEQLRIFDAFRKIESNKQKLYRGTGIGLAIVKSLADKLNGRIFLTSKIHEGSSFTIQFPIT